MKQPKVIIFDFDGTIADSSETLFAIFNRLSAPFGYKKLSSIHVAELRNKTSREMYQALKVPTLKMPFFVRKARAELRSCLSDIPLIYGMKKTVLDLKEAGYSLGILSSNTEANIHTFLAQHDLDIFDFITSTGLFSKHKELQSIAKRLKVTPEQMIYIGDETRDVDAAHKAGIPMVAVTWGVNTKAILQTANPNFLADSPKELSALFTNK